jgi:hypothetical protein
MTITRPRPIGLESVRNGRTRLVISHVLKIATSAWQHDAAGLNFFTRPRVMLDHDIVDELAATNSDAVALLVVLERYHGGNDRFILANEMASRMRWGLERWRAARDLHARPFHENHCRFCNYSALCAEAERRR